MKKPNYPEERFPIRTHITYITLDISYINDKKVRIRKIHNDIESEELKKSKYKIDDEIYIYDNQIDLDMFSNLSTKSCEEVSREYLNLDSEGFITIKKNIARFGIDIYVSMKNPDEQLNDNLCKILHQLCKKYLKTSIMYIGRDSIICRIENCSYSEDILKKFLEGFVIKTEKTILRKI